MNSTNWHTRFHIERRPYDFDGLRLYWVEERMELGVKQQRHATSIEYSEMEQGMQIDPVATISTNDAQQLMDALWDLGIRPAGAMGSAGQLEAVNRHLEDMRTLVLKDGAR